MKAERVVQGREFAVRVACLSAAALLGVLLGACGAPPSLNRSATATPAPVTSSAPADGVNELCLSPPKKALVDFEDLLPPPTADWITQELVRVEGVERVTVCRYESHDAHELNSGGTVTLVDETTISNPGELASDMADLKPLPDAELTCPAVLTIPAVLFTVRLDYDSDIVWLLVTGSCGSVVDNGHIRIAVPPAANRMTPTAKLESSLTSGLWPTD